MSYSDVVATIALFVSFVGTFASGYISYHYAIKGERRKEYNLVADRLTLLLMNQASNALNSNVPPSTLSEADIDALVIVSNSSDEGKIRNSYANYQMALEKSCSIGQGRRWEMHSPDLFIDAVRGMLEWTKHK
ncbi:hypothetical protein ACWO30_003194 [Citrobacter freundii]|uniref:Uncharacterized protein n=1 Tax=Citrobacter freundii TaxID=546 RepID=A0AAI9HFG6_CITFR|nr:hypothetical protein [Citrobacter freundii]